MARTRRLSQSFLRITLAADDLADIEPTGLDQRIKLVLPREDRGDLTGYETFPFEGDWYQNWRDQPAHERNTFRTYTLRSLRADRGEMDVDVVMHADGGPAARWAAATEVGDELVIIGPDGRSEHHGSGVEWHPRGAKNVLIAGDETAVPAISAIVEALPRDARGCVFLEVPSSDDVLSLAAPDGVDVHWLPRASSDLVPSDENDDEGGTPGDTHALTHADADAHADADTGSDAVTVAHADTPAEAQAVAHGAALLAAVRDWTSRFVTAHHHGAATDAQGLAEVDIDHDILWEVPAETDLTGELYAWLAGEAGAIKTLRRFLVGEVGIDRRQVAFMGYWRLGKSEN